MKKSFKLVLSILLIVLIVILVYTFLIKTGVVRNYHIKDFVIDVTVDEDDIIVKEDTLYRFNGKYNGITITIPTDVSKEYYEKLTEDSMNDSNVLPDSLYISNGIENVKIYVAEEGKNRYFKQVDKANIGDAGVYTVSDENGFTTYTIYEPSESIDKRIVFEYKLKDVIVQHKDCQELFWNFIGGEFDCKIKNLKINIYGKNILKAYTHGNATGKLKEELDLDKVIVTYNNVKLKEFVSVRMLFDSFSSNIAKQSNVEALQIIEGLEDSYLNKKQTMVGFIIVAIFMTIAIIIYWLFLLVKYETEIEPVPLVFDEFDIINKYNPMIAACIAQNRGMHPRDILAVLIDLVNIGALKMLHVVGYVIGSQEDIYKLSKNQAFFEDEEKLASLDEIQLSVIQIFFGNDLEIELTKKLKDIQTDSEKADLIKELDTKVVEKLESIGANFKSVPKLVRVFNTVLFIGITIYAIAMIAYSRMLDVVTLSTVGEKLAFNYVTFLEYVLIIIVLLIPLLLLVIKLVIKLLDFIRKTITKLAFKLTTKKLTRTIIILFSIFVLIFGLEILLLRNSNIIIATILFFAGLLVVLTDNLMTSHSTAIRKEYVMLKLLQDKIENGSLLDEKNIKDNILWNRYFTFAVALGFGNVAQYVKYIPDSLAMLDTFNMVTEGGYNLYNLDRELAMQVRLNSFTRSIDKFNSGYVNAMFSGGGSSGSSGGFGGSSGGGFSSGGGRFSGGGGRGGGRGAF